MISKKFVGKNDTIFKINSNGESTMSIVFDTNGYNEYKILPIHFYKNKIKTDTITIIGP
ncbi:MAG: hypothetical protein ACJAV5_001810, partial [Vicingaceae bacterium]